MRVRRLLQSRWRVLAVFGLLAIHVAMLLVIIARNFVTMDEVAHVPAGLYAWETSRFDLYPNNPPLPRLVAAAPLLLQSPNTDWRSVDTRPGVRTEFAVGNAFFQTNGEGALSLYQLARLPGLAWSILGALVVFFWSRALYGYAAGLMALVLWCFEPNILAHAALATPDIPATATAVTATYVFWHYLRNPTWAWALGAGCLLGLAELTKFTLLTLYVVWPVLWLVGRQGQRWQLWLGHGMAIFGTSFAVLNTGYLWKNSFQPLGSYEFVSKTLASPPPAGGLYYDQGRSGNRFGGTWLGAIPVPFPADYLRGIDLQQRDFEAKWPSYLAGRWEHHGWWYFYFHAMAVKVPLGLLGLLVWRWFWPPGVSKLRDEIAIWLPAFVILAAASAHCGFSHHFRYVLPAFPFAMIGVSRVAGWWTCARSRAAKLVAGGLLLWAIGSSFSVFPHTLAYFNELGGGPTNGHDHLLYSNIDWGQDLLALKSWLDRHPKAKDIRIAYFNSLSPVAVGLPIRLPPLGPLGGYPDDPGYPYRVGPQPGWFAVSVNLIRGAPAVLTDGSGEYRNVPLHGYEYFQYFAPYDRVGYSIYIYHLSPADVDRVRAERLALPPLAGSPMPTAQ